MRSEEVRVRLELLRWPDGPVCPECGSGASVRARGTPGFYRCWACGDFAFTVRTGTIFARSPLPLDKWIDALRFFRVNGRAQRELGEAIGVTFRTAGLILKRFSQVPGSPLTIQGILSHKADPKSKAAKRRKRRASRAA